MRGVFLQGAEALSIDDPQVDSVDYYRVAPEVDASGAGAREGTCCKASALEEEPVEQA